MKKRFLSLISVAVAVMIMVATFSGCKLVKKDKELEMKTVVATVQIDPSIEKESIYKQDMIMAYMSYGYYYVQYQSYTQAQVFELIIENLINNRILVQNAIKDAGKTKIDDCLTEDQKTSAKYNTYESFNEMLDSYADNNSDTEDAKGDTLTLTERTIPTNAANKTKTLTLEEKKSYIEKGFDTTSTEDRRAGFADVVKLLKNNGLLGDDYDGKDLTTTDYYKNLYKSYCENELLTQVSNKIAQDTRNLSVSDLETEYAKKVNTQTEWSNEEFVEALSSATASDPIVCGAYGTYGYVYNLLLGVDDYQSSALSNIKTENPNITDEEYSTARNEILRGITVKDQRASWILSGYDCEYVEADNTVKFTGDYDMTKNNPLEFQGTVKLLKEKTDDESAEYFVTSTKIFGLDEFIEFMDNYVYGETKTGDSVTDTDIKKQVTVANKPEEYEGKINNLLFAFSTDSGSLNTWKGYAIKPVPDGSNSEEYVQTFADAARTLLGLGGSSYIIVATDYGYHVMFFSEILDNSYTTDCATLEKYIEKIGVDLGDKTLDEYVADMLSKWDDDDFEDSYDTDSFLYKFIDSLTSTKVSNAQSKYNEDIVKQYRYDETKVVVNEKSYSDLLG